MGGMDAGPTGGVGGHDAADAGSCVDPLGQATIAWTFSPADAGTGTGDSGCQVTPNPIQPDVTCSGAAWLRAGDAGPTLTWDDGNQLVWDTSTFKQPIVPPIEAGAPDLRVWAQFTRHVQVICSFCGSYTNQTVEVRDAAGGPTLHLGIGGHRLPGPTSAQVTALFGVDALAQATCTLQTADGCTPISRTLQEHVLQTPTPVVIPAGTLTQLLAPNGQFQVYWYEASDQPTGSPTCVDNNAAGPPIGFVATRTGVLLAK